MKSDCGLKAHSGATKQCVSEEEMELRQHYAYDFPHMTKKEFETKVEDIRKRTGKP